MYLPSVWKSRSAGAARASGFAAPVLLGAVVVAGLLPLRLLPLLRYAQSQATIATTPNVEMWFGDPGRRRTLNLRDR